jgi:hypothetical protein
VSGGDDRNEGVSPLARAALGDALTSDEAPVIVTQHLADRRGLQAVCGSFGFLRDQESVVTCPACRKVIEQRRAARLKKASARKSTGRGTA